jgi:hypothetical protein
MLKNPSTVLLTGAWGGAGIWIICGALGLDRRTTLELSVLSLTMISALAGAAAAIFAVWYFSPSNRDKLPEKFAGLLRRSPLQWAALGGFGIVFLGGLWAFIGYQILSMLSQHLGTAAQPMPAETLRTERAYGRALCREWLYVRFPDDSENRLCLRTRSSPSIVSFEPGPGDRLILNVKHSVFGDAVTGLARAAPP